MEPVAPAASPYAPPRSDTNFAGDPDGQGDLTDDEIAAFVGEGSGYYRRAWATANRTGGFYAGFNVAALVVSTLWLLYRKMYLAFVVLMAVQTVVTFVAFFAGTLLGGEGGEVVMLAVLPGILLTKLVMGFIGNGLYLRRARRIVRAARLTSPGAVNLPHLATRGGTSMVAVVIGILVNIVLNVLSG